jgi:hypothetical protein
MAPELPSRLPFDVRLSRASTRAKIALVRAICRVFGVYGATRFLLATIDWGEPRPGRPTVLCLNRPLFAKDLEELRRRTDVNWISVNNEFLAHVQSAWVPAEMRVEKEYQSFHRPGYEKHWAKLEEFGLAFLGALQRRLPIDAVMTSHIDYWHGEGVRLGARGLGILYIALCREHMCLPIEQKSVREFFTGFKWEGDGVAVFGQSTKEIFVNSGACTEDQVVVTGPPRLDIWREVPPRAEPHDLVVLLSYRDPDYRAPQSFTEVLRIFRDVAASDPGDAVFWVKSKDTRDTEEIRALVGSTGRNFIIDHDTPLYELFPRARLVVGFNSLSLVEALFSDTRIAIPCWSDADRPREELVFDPDDARLGVALDFSRSPGELKEELELAARGKLRAPASAEERLEVVRKIFYVPPDLSCSREVERFVRSQVGPRPAPAASTTARSPVLPSRWAPASIFLAWLAIAGLAARWDAPGLLSTILAAPVYYALPLGLGLLVTQPLERSVTRTQRALLAYLTGLILICALLVLREQAWPARISIHVFTLAILAASVGGFALAQRFFAWNEAAKCFAKDFLIVLPIFAIGLVIRFGVFSEYPVTDLFQATHLMKGAQEFGRFDILNPFTADSYVPAIQAVEGLLVRFLAFDGLLGAWVLPVLATLPKFIACRAAFQSVLRTRESWVFATAIAACFLSALAPTNGDFAALGSMLLFSLAVGAAGSGRLASAAGVVIAGLVALLVGHFATRSYTPLYIVVLAAMCLLPLGRVAGRAPARLLAVPLLIVVLAPLHRSTLVFVPLALVFGALIPLLNSWLDRRRASAQVVGAVTGIVTAVAAAWAVGLLVWILMHPGERMQEAGLYRWLLELVLGVSATEANVIVGSGPKVALFELGRAMSPSFAGLAGIAVMLVFIQVMRWPGLTRGAGWAATRHALVTWGLAMSLGAALLIGVPFVYRSGFLVILLLATALAAAFDAFVEPRAKTMYRGILFIAAAYIVAVIPVAYRCGSIARCTASDYLERAWPFLAGFGALICAAAVFGVVFAHGGRLFRYVTKTVVVLLFALEIGISRAYFMPYSYGAALPRESEAVSHLSRGEIQLATELRGLTNPVVLISDPFTMANLRALTGLNSVLTYSNLDTVSAVGTQRLQKWLRETIEPGRPGTDCASMHPLDLTYDSANAAEFNYWLARQAQGPQVSGSSILGIFGIRASFLPVGDRSVSRRPDELTDHAWRAEAVKGLSAALRAKAGELQVESEPQVLLVIDQKTVDWARGDKRVSYFPDARPLDPKLVAALGKRCPLRVYDQRFAVVSFPMEKR